MPTYPVVCQSCKFSLDIFEHWQRKDETIADTACPNCGQKQLKQVFSSQYQIFNPEIYGYTNTLYGEPNPRTIAERKEKRSK